MGYREFPAPPQLRTLVECAWVRDGSPEPVRVLPDGCMDLIEMPGRVLVAGPDTTAFVSEDGREPLAGLRFRPGVLPRLLRVPAAELRNTRVPLAELRAGFGRDRSSVELASMLAAEEPTKETAPWSLDQLGRITASLGNGATVADVARRIGWSTRTVQRQCGAVYGYGGATLRRILRFRRAVRLLEVSGSTADVAAAAGYADQPHLHREVRQLTGRPLAAMGSPTTGRRGRPTSRRDR